MNGRVRSALWLQLLLVLALLLPVAVLFLLPGGPLIAGGLWFWFVLPLCFWLIWGLFGWSAGPAVAAVPEPRPIPEGEQPGVVREVMGVHGAVEEDGVRVFYGPLRGPAEAAYERLRRELPADTVPMLQEDERHGAALVLLPKTVEEATLERPARPWVPLLLFALTVVTTTWAGAAQQGVDLLREPGRFAVGLPYALALLAVLGVHELGHSVAARYHGIRVTPPYFIPLPSALGTFGAFIQMRSPTENRRALFDVAVAGPLAGLVVAIPLLLIGLGQSSAVPGTVVGGRVTAPADPADPAATAPPAVVGGTSAGSSLLLALLAKLAMPEALRHGCVLQLSPLAFAGWLGIFITGLNLLPVGQLDGGHAARAVFGYRLGGAVSSIAMWSLLFLGIFVWPGLLMWAIIVFFVAGDPTPPLNDVTPVTPGRRLLGYATFALMLLILVPLPHALWPAAGIHCPYVG
ncbi:MAG: site-2 protease family protein [Gemmataceae bacterium]|nr:site-2 protease family protein [Gemmataceae bacterium]